jgi:hypothetical protein
MESGTDVHVGTDRKSEQDGISAACRTTRKMETEICSNWTALRQKNRQNVNGQKGSLSQI